MNEKTIRITRRYAELAFVGLATAFLLAFVFSQAARGPAGLPGVVVYGFAAGFGLEYVSSVWTGRAARRQLSRQLSR
ncbi:MAG TPA: hypothetical protein VFD31_08485 [Thermoleophilaceae bacterium]|nr:hypothetical protein [Thermoleophilaceae bacterium]